MERIIETEFWLLIREGTRVNGGVGACQCEGWCKDVLENENVANEFTPATAELGEIQIDQYATSILTHNWLERGDGFITDGTAGQFDPEYPEGYYGYPNNAPDKLKAIYAKKK